MDVSDETLEHLLDDLRERAPDAGFHIGGGEPFLDLPRLRRVVRGLTERGLTVEYVETNALWVQDRQTAEQVLRDLAEDGLPCVLVSLSPFHAEYIPLSRTMALIAAARAALPRGALVWMPHFLGDIAPYDRDRPIDLDAHLRRHGEAYARDLAAQYALVPGGRAGRFLHAWGQRVPWERLRSASPCRRRLVDTTHFHVDLEGNYLPGLCAGLRIPFHEVPGPVDLDRYPVLRALVEGGVGALVDLAHWEAGFVPRDTYASACDLCGHARSFLVPLDYREIGPADFYDPRSLGSYTGL